MAATNFTPIILYHTTTASAAPTAGNLNNGELAINITDGKLFYKDNGGTVQVIATKGTGTIGGSNTQVQYNSSGALAGSANFTFNGTTATINTLNLTNALGTAYGGTALTTYTQGDLVYASAANTLAKLGIGANTYILTSTGSVPQWSAPSAITVSTATNLAGGAAGSVPYQSGASTTTFLSIGTAGQVLTSSGSAPQWSSPAALTKTDDTNVTLTLGGSASTALLNAASLTLGWTGQLSVARGGTNATATPTAGAVAYGTGTAYAFTAAGSSGQILTSSGAGAPTWTSLSSVGVTTFSAGTTGFTPSSATSGAITLAGTLATTNGGTGLTSFTANGVMYASSTSALATGSVLTFDGAQLGVNGITVGRGAGAVVTNTTVGLDALVVNTTGAYNTAVGSQSLRFNTSGQQNSAFGHQALYTNTTGNFNSANSMFALYANTTGSNNTAVGLSALEKNTTASNNTAVGFQAGYSNTTGSELVAVGYGALRANTTAAYNTAVGYTAGYSLTTGEANTAVGRAALQTATTPNFNVAVGYRAMIATTTGANNTAIGTEALQANTTASNNTAVGYQAGYSNTTGASNTVVGYQAALNNLTGQHTVVGKGSLAWTTVSTGNAILGYDCITSASATTNVQYNTAIGNTALQGLQNGATYNTAVGFGSGSAITTGAKNTILGAYNGNQGGLDIRTASNNLVLSDGDGNVLVAYYNAAPLTKISGVLTHNYADTQSKSQINLYDNTNGNTEIASGYSTADFVVATGGTTGNLAYSARANGYFVTNTGIIALINTTFTVGSNTYTVTASSSEGYIYCTPDPIGEAATGTLVGVKYATEGFRVQDNRTARFRSTVGVGNALGATSGAGITFPAAQSASSDANTLDDYEEGTWTPVDSGGMTGFSAINGTYVKIGNLVHVRGSFSITSVTTNMFISGLPFAAATTYYSVVYSGIAVAIAFARVEAAAQIQWNVNATGGGNQTVEFTAWYQV